MDRHMHLVEPGPFAPHRWPSIALASAELRRPRHLHAVPDGAGGASPGRNATPEVRPPLPSRRR